MEEGRAVVRMFGTLLVAGLVAAACSGGAPSTAPTRASSTPPGAATPWARAAASPTAAGECVKVTHALGESCIPAAPQRVVTLGCQTSLEYALALGLPIVGYDVAPWEPVIPPYLDPAPLADAATLGSCFAPDLELVNQADPDLIIYTFDNGNYPQVSEIAPTVVLQVGYADYRDDFLAAAELLGRTEQANAVLADLDTRISALAAELRPIVEGKTVSAFQTATGGKATYYGAGSYIGALLADLGIELPPDQSGSYGEVSLEQIGLLDGDIGLAVYGYTDPSLGEDADATKQQFLDSPLWSTLKFVRDGQLHEMDKEVWSVHGIYWADALLEDLRAKLLPS